MRAAAAAGIRARAAVVDIFNSLQLSPVGLDRGLAAAGGGGRGARPIPPRGIAPDPFSPGVCPLCSVPMPPDLVKELDGKLVNFVGYEFDMVGRSPAYDSSRVLTSASAAGKSSCS